MIGRQVGRREMKAATLFLWVWWLWGVCSNNPLDLSLAISPRWREKRVPSFFFVYILYLFVPGRFSIFQSQTIRVWRKSLFEPTITSLTNLIICKHMKAPWELLITTENVYRTFKNMWEYPENNWKPIIGQLTNINNISIGFVIISQY